MPGAETCHRDKYLSIEQHPNLALIFFDRMPNLGLDYLLLYIHISDRCYDRVGRVLTLVSEKMRFGMPSIGWPANRREKEERCNPGNQQTLALLAPEFIFCVEISDGRHRHREQPKGAARATIRTDDIIIYPVRAYPLRMFLYQNHLYDVLPSWTLRM
jgi:hypothetical protein